ncbi:MAG TPA: hypothetical protein PKD10_18340 [Paracoccaceae bacterium]|nr:hypothetical protein [Paracoccaceae bacterium]HMO73118.1 hypothetical protein [Paracoccaceae bacterium]
MADVREVLVAPVASMIVEVGRSVAEASTALSLAQVEAYRKVPQPLLDAGMIPVMFHMQDVQVELKMTLEIETTATSGSGRKWGIFARPVNAASEASSRSLTTGASTLKLTFAPGPAPLAVEQGG